ncbi:MAG: glycosyltransferase family 2 protein [Acidimicrobiales bacterium]
MSTVDVVIPCYNYARFLERCVDSVLSQDGVDARVLIIDDCSSDETPDVGTELAARHPAVEFRRHEQNQGHIATYNEGLLGWAGGDYSVLLSADDLLTPGALGRAVAVMERDPRVAMVYGRPVFFESHENLPAVTQRAKGVAIWAGYDWIAGRCADGHNVISSPEVVVRGPVQRAVGGYRPELPHAGDLEMWLRIAARGHVAYVRGAPQAYYRVHAGSMQRSQFGSCFADLRQRQAVFDAFFERHGHEVPDADRLHELAGKALAREALWRACRGYDRNQVAAAQSEELAAFALDACPTARRLPEYAALARRRRLGASLCRRTQLFAMSAAAHRARNWLWWASWRRRGV